MPQKKEMEPIRKQDNDLELQQILTDQVTRFLELVAPYSIAEGDKLVNENSSEELKKYSYYVLHSCATESVDEIAEYLSSRIEKLFVSLYALGCSVIYGIISRNGTTNIIIAVPEGNKEHSKSVLEGLLTGIEIEEFSFDQLVLPIESATGKGGFISGVPITKIDDEKKYFDLSALMRSLNGRDYTVLFYAEPVDQAMVREKYSEVLRIRDVCATISKRNVSKQNSENTTVTHTRTESGRSLISEAICQLYDKVKYGTPFNGDGFIDSILNGRRISNSESTNDTIKALSESESYDIQNGIALEMISYCDKAIERLKQGQGIGLWNVAISYAAGEKDADILYACLNGELSKPSTDILPIRNFQYELRDNQTVYLLSDTGKEILCPTTSNEVAIMCTPPSTAVPNFELRTRKMYPLISMPGEVVLGKVSDGYRPLSNMPFALSENDLNKHTFICGITGSGKTTTVKEILRNCEKPFMVIESAKKEYRSIKLKNGRDNPIVYTLGKPEINSIQINPFYVQCGINLQTHIDFLKDLFNASFSFYGPMPYILEKSLQNIYRQKGWNLTLGYHPELINIGDRTNLFDQGFMEDRYARKATEYLFPTMQDLKNEIKRYIECEMKYEGEVAGNIKTAMLARLESLCNGAKGYMFNTSVTPDMKELMEKNVVFELEGLADDADKAFAVGLFIIFVNEYRQVCKEVDDSRGLKHLLVIEEAHRLLKNVNTEKATEETANPKGKAVEHFTNILAEMRSYGQGVVIAEQIPSKLAPDVIKNSSNKIVQRIVARDDQGLMASTIGLKEDDGVFLGSLKCGEGLCHKEGMTLPVFVSITPPEKEDAVTDSILQKKYANDSFRSIDYCSIKENTANMVDEIAFKMLNTILAEDPGTTIESINAAIRQMKSELKRADVFLLCNMEEANNICAQVLFDATMGYFSSGAYVVKSIFTDDIVFNCANEVFSIRLPEKVVKLKECLSDTHTGYGEKCRRRCAKIVATEIVRNLKPETQIMTAIDSFFMAPPRDFYDEVKLELKSLMERGNGNAGN